MHGPLDNPDTDEAKPARALTAVGGAAVWHGGWAVGLFAAAALLIVAIGQFPILGCLACLMIALPGAIGALWLAGGPVDQRAKAGLLGVWAAGAMMAASIEGGLTGPLAIWCVMPAIAAVALDGPWLFGVGGAAAAGAGAGLVQALGVAWRHPTGPIELWLTIVALVTVSCGAAGALVVAQRRADARRAEVQAELDSFQAIMGDLPELALAMDAEGRAQAVFGEPLPGIEIDALHHGLVEVASEPDRDRVSAALREAVNYGASEATFTPLGAIDQRVTVRIRRASNGVLTAVLREASGAAPRAVLPVLALPPSAPAAPAYEDLSAPMAVLTARFAASERARAEAETARLHAEEGREKAEAEAESRSRFLANMSHELRTPLNAIMGFSDIMREKMFGPLPAKYAEYAQLIHESGGHLMDLINDVLDMSKIEARRFVLSREAFDARDAVNAALRLMRLQADEAGVKLRGVLPATALEVEADKRAIKQIVLNLVSNALKFTPRDGSVTVTLAEAAGALELVVSDTGVGVAPEDLARLGRPYEQAGTATDRVMGTGLGLSLVRSFAELHGGAMTIESRLGEGTAVTVRMPVLAAPHSPASVHAPTRQPEMGEA